MKKGSSRKRASRRNPALSETAVIRRKLVRALEERAALLDECALELRASSFAVQEGFAISLATMRVLMLLNDFVCQKAGLDEIEALNQRLTQGLNR